MGNLKHNFNFPKTNSDVMLVFAYFIIKSARSADLSKSTVRKNKVIRVVFLRFD